MTIRVSELDFFFITDVTLISWGCYNYKTECQYCSFISVTDFKNSVLMYFAWRVIEFHRLLNDEMAYVSKLEIFKNTKICTYCYCGIRVIGMLHRINSVIYQIGFSD